MNLQGRIFCQVFCIYRRYYEGGLSSSRTFKMLCDGFCNPLRFLRTMKGKSFPFLLHSHSLRNYQGFYQKSFFSLYLKTTLFPRELCSHSSQIFFKEYLVDNNLDDLIALLKRGKIEDNLLDLFPIQKRTTEAFAEHFSKDGLGALVEK